MNLPCSVDGDKSPSFAAGIAVCRRGIRLRFVERAIAFLRREFFFSASVENDQCFTHNQTEISSIHSKHATYPKDQVLKILNNVSILTPINQTTIIIIFLTYD